MKETLKKSLLSTSVIAGMSVLVTSPALAATFSVSGSNLYYESDGSNTSLSGTNVTSVDLTGNSSAPGNNIELGGQVGNNNTADFLNPTTLSGSVGGQAITLSSLTADDWFGTGNITSSYGDNDFANQWFSAALDAYNFDSLLVTANQLAPFTGQVFDAQQTKTNLFNTFLAADGFQRASDPNISYVNQEEGEIKIGLAGHFDLNDQIDLFLAQNGLGNFAALVPQNVQLSEVVKVSYGGVDELFYGLTATGSGLSELGDGISHNGNYEIKIAAAPESVPEPTTILGTLTAGGLLAASRRKKKRSI